MRASDSARDSARCLLRMAGSTLRSARVIRSGRAAMISRRNRRQTLAYYHSYFSSKNMRLLMFTNRQN